MSDTPNNDDADESEATPPTPEELQAEIDEVKDAIAKGEESAREAEEGERPKWFT